MVGCHLQLTFVVLCVSAILVVTAELANDDEFSQLWEEIGAELMGNSNTNVAELRAMLNELMPTKPEPSVELHHQEDTAVQEESHSNLQDFMKDAEEMEKVDKGEECFAEVVVGVKKSAGDNLYLEILTNDSSIHNVKITCSDPNDAQTQILRHFLVDSDFGSTTKRKCFYRSEIVSVKLSAGASDKVHVSSIATYLQNENRPYTKLTCDPKLEKEINQNPIDLTFYGLPKQYQCIKTIVVHGVTASGKNSGCNAQSSNKDSCAHQIQLDLIDGTSLVGEITPGASGKSFHQIMDLEYHYKANCLCVKRSDIKRVMLLAESNDAWHINSITTEYLTEEAATYEVLTQDSDLDTWLNLEDACYDIEDNITLTLMPFTDIPKCGYGLPVCECAKTAKTCKFNLEIEEIMTFTSYQKFKDGDREGLYYKGKKGVIYYINETDGERKPLEDDTCSVDNANECSEPQFVDGKTFRLAIGVNGQIPGPTIIVHHNQRVVIDVQNKLTSEGISIHWHGMFQRGTPWMDGVGGITQCHIAPSSSYSYIYTANPSGTFWYHSHSGAQRTDGMYGALIVKESDSHYVNISTRLREDFDIDGFLDHPEMHSLTLLDWARESSLDTFVRQNAGLGFFPQTPIGDVPSPESERYGISFGPEQAGIGPIPFYSGLINGLGRHKEPISSNSVPYSKTRLSVFNVVEGQKYRFRLIGAQGEYAYRFSIDGHSLTVVGTDGYWIEPVKNVDYIIIHTGERYDFILNAKLTDNITKYWIRAETLEVHIGANTPYTSYGHVAEAILQYVQPDQPIPIIESTEYKDIRDKSPLRKCTKQSMCKAVNCPFLNYHENYYIKCINVDQFKLLLPTPPEELPESDPCEEEGCRYFLNFNFNGKSFRASINGRSFLPPPAPPVTQRKLFDEQAVVCNATSDCQPATIDCLCTHLIEIPYKKTVQLVLTSYYGFLSVHPIHLHGHAFHIAKIGYPEYNKENGTVKTVNKDISCNVEEDCSFPCQCTNPGWTNDTAPRGIEVTSNTVRKDTVIVPAGGYVVINFISDNPGYWFMHCHIEPHQLEGMALIVGEAVIEAANLPVPEELNKCGDVKFTMKEYLESRRQFSMLAKSWH